VRSIFAGLVSQCVSLSHCPVWVRGEGPVQPPWCTSPPGTGGCRPGTHRSPQTPRATHLPRAQPPPPPFSVPPRGFALGPPSNLRFPLKFPPSPDTDLSPDVSKAQPSRASPGSRQPAPQHGSVPIAVPIPIPIPVPSVPFPAPLLRSII